MLPTIPRKMLGLSFAAALMMAGTASAQSLDEVNGLWTSTVNGAKAGQVQTESYAEIGVRLRFDGKIHNLKRTGDVLTVAKDNNGIIDVLDEDTQPTADSPIELKIKGLETKDPADDSLEGKFFGKDVVFKRDVAIKPVINLKFPGDRPWVRFMREILIPKTAEDRDSYHMFNKVRGSQWIKSTQLGATGYWYTKGWINGETGFENLTTGMNGVKNTPRRILNTKFSSLVEKNMRADKKGEAALAMSSLGMYFSTASGGAVRMYLTENGDSIIYYITDRRANSRTGLVVMKTPTHRALASSFGKWQNDAGDMALSDDEPYNRALFEMMAKSSAASLNNLTPVARSAYTDYLGVMAIEDQRGVMFNDEALDWGRNMTEASFCISIIRALSHGQTRQQPKWDRTAKKVVLSSKKELAMQVVVEGGWDGTGARLQPGIPSYIDTLNGADNALEGGTKGGDDCQIYGLRTMKTLTTKWLRTEHKAKLDRLEKALAPFSTSAAGGEDIFATICDVFYDNAKFGKVTQAQATEICEAAMACMNTVTKESRKLEAFMLANGVVKSDEQAPRASGF